MIAFPFGLMFGLVAIPIVLGLSRWFGLYTVVGESQCQVFTLFGKVIGQIEEPGLRFPIPVSYTHLTLPTMMSV